MSSDFVSIGDVLTHVKEVNDLECRAQTVQDFIHKENQSIGNAYDRYLES